MVVKRLILLLIPALLFALGAGVMAQQEEPDVPEKPLVEWLRSLETSEDADVDPVTLNHLVKTLTALLPQTETRLDAANQADAAALMERTSEAQLARARATLRTLFHSWAETLERSAAEDAAMPTWMRDILEQLLPLSTRLEADQA